MAAGESSSRATQTGSKRQKAPLPTSSDSDPDSGLETDSSEDVTEDEDGVDLTPALDAAILRTLAKIRNKNGVYEGENVLENELKEAEEKVIKAGIKAMPNRKEEIKKYTLADHHRAALLNGKAGDDVEEEEERQPLTHVESQYKIRNEAVSAFKALADDLDSGSDDEEAGGLVKREREEAAIDVDDEEYRRFLLEMGGGEEEVRKILGMGGEPIKTARISDDEADAAVEAGSEGIKVEKKRKKKSAKSKENKAKQDDEFLMNYILNRGWIDRTEERVPTYDEIVGKPKVEQAASDDEQEDTRAGGPSHPWGELDEEDEFDEKAEEFEHAYNFRFEEPGSSNILTHPREIPALVRRTDDTRATKRAAKAERKAAEKAEKEEQARRLKGEKRREMEKQMASLRKDLGIKEGQGVVDWDELEKVMEGDFDEEEWQRVVGKMLESRDDEEEPEEDDDEKPEWDDDVVEMEYEEPDDEEVQMHLTYVPDDDAGYPDAEEDGPINMDADFDGEAPSSKKRKKNKKGKNKAVDQDTIVEENDDEDLTVADKAKKVKKAMEEYKALDHEDMIGDMPTRFKYTRSKPTAFGLTPAEILLATDKELDQIAGLRHIAPYRKQGLGMQGRGISKRIYDLKQKLRNRKWGEEMEYDQDGKPVTIERNRDAGWGDKKRKNAEGEGEGEGGEKKKKRLGKKQRERERMARAEGGVEVEPSGSGSGPAAGNRYEEPVAAPAPAEQGEEKEGKVRRRKKKTSQQKEELKIFD